MSKTSKWISTVLTGLWVFGCSHSPGPATKVTQSPSPQEIKQTATTQGTPALAVAETEFDFGEVAEGNDYVHDFRIANKGDGALEIVSVFPA